MLDCTITPQSSINAVIDRLTDDPESNIGGLELMPKANIKVGPRYFDQAAADFLVSRLTMVSVPSNTEGDMVKLTHVSFGVDNPPSANVGIRMTRNFQDVIKSMTVPIDRNQPPNQEILDTEGLHIFRQEIAGSTTHQAGVTLPVLQAGTLTITGRQETDEMNPAIQTSFRWADEDKPAAYKPLVTIDTHSRLRWPRDSITIDSPDTNVTASRATIPVAGVGQIMTSNPFELTNKLLHLTASHETRQAASMIIANHRTQEPLLVTQQFPNQLNRHRVQVHLHSPSSSDLNQLDDQIFGELGAPLNANSQEDATMPQIPVMQHRDNNTQYQMPSDNSLLTFDFQSDGDHRVTHAELSNAGGYRMQTGEVTMPQKLDLASGHRLTVDWDDDDVIPPGIICQLEMIPTDGTAQPGAVLDDPVLLIRQHATDIIVTSVTTDTIAQVHALAHKTRVNLHANINLDPDMTQPVMSSPLPVIEATLS